MASTNHNPAVSPQQYRMAQAVLSGTSTGMPVKVAREIVDKTPGRLRSEWSKNPVYGMDLDLETSMAPAWKYYDSKKARDYDARLKEGEGKKVVKGYSIFGFSEGKGSKWRMRLADNRGNPKKRPSDVDGNPVPQNYEMLSIRRNQGDALDVKKALTVADIPSVIVEPPTTTFGASTGNWSVWTPKKTYKRAVKLAEKAYFDRYPERVGNPSKAFGGNVHAQLSSAVTQYDMKEQAKAAKKPHGYYNMYALPQYLGRVTEVEAEIKAGTPVRKALTDAFTGRLLDAVLKAVGEPRSTKEEQRGGSITYRPTRDNPFMTDKDRARLRKKQNFLLKLIATRPAYTDDMRITEGGPTIGELREIIFPDWEGAINQSIRNLDGDPETLKMSRRKNPRSASDDMYASFHGEPSDETIEYQNEEHYHSNLAAVGVLVEMKVKLVTGGTAVIGFEDAGNEETSNPKNKKTNPFWPFNSFTKTVIYHVGSGDKYTAKGTHSGYTVYQDNKTGNFLIPKLDSESRFDTKKDATKFIDHWKKQAKNPASRVDKGGFSDAHIAGQKWLWARLKTAKGSFNSASAPDGYLKKLGLESTRHMSLAYQSESVKERILRAQQIYKDFMEGVDYAWNKHFQNQHPSSDNPGPFREAGKMVGKVTSAASRPMDEFTSAAGKVAGYLDDQLGRVLSKKRNPQREYKTEESFRKALAKVTADGTLVHWYGTDHGWVIVTKRPVKSNPEDRDTGPAYLTTNEEGTQLFIIGGDQSLDLPSLGITGQEASKELITIGDVKNICYHASKTFDGKEEEYDYVHKMGEDGGDLPTLIYDRINRQLKLSGGSYFIKRPLVGTSPGIEN